MKIDISKEDIEQIIESLDYHFGMTECVEEHENNERIINIIESQIKENQ